MAAYTLFQNRFLKKIQMSPKIQMQFQTGFLPHNGLLFSDAASHKALSACLSVLCRCFCIYCMYVCMYIFSKAVGHFVFYFAGFDENFSQK